MDRKTISGMMPEKAIEYLFDTIDERDRRIAEISQDLANTKETLAQLRHKVFGSQSEKKHVGYENPMQLTIADLFNEAEAYADPSVPDPTETEIIAGYTRHKAGAKKPKADNEELYGDLPFRNVLCHVAPEDLICPDCGSVMEHIGWDTVRTEIEIIPAQVRKVVILQEKVRCRQCYDKNGYAEVIKAEVPSALIKGSPASSTTVAYVMYQKYINAMPLYRQEKDWRQMGISIQRATLANWCITCGRKYMKPVYDALMAHLLRRAVNSADETTCQVLHEKDPARKAQQKSYMWLHSTSGLDGEPPIMLYEYQMTRAGYHPEKFYKSFTGKYIICDGYQGYNKLPAGIIRCGCLAHFRRYFYEAIPAEGRKAGRSSSPAAKIVNLCSEIFTIEREFIGLSHKERKQKREESKEHQIWKEIWSSLDTMSASSGSRLGKAITYAQNQKSFMENYFLDGRIPVSNNFMESCGARPYAVGRKNFYFHDTENGAEASAIIYSLALTAKYNNISVFKYLQAVLLYMPDYVDEPEGIEELMPWSEKMQTLCKINDKPVVEDSKRISE